MDSREHECGVCYRTFNAGRRCPRELHCKHSFCESCLRALSRPLGAQRLIVCPLCRHATSISSGDGAEVRAELRVDECVLERLIVCGVLDQEEEEEEEEEEEGPVGRVCQEPTLPETPAEEGDFSSGSRGGRLRGGWRRVWRSISGKRRNRDDCMSGENMRDLALMSIYMF